MASLLGKRVFAWLVIALVFASTAGATSIEIEGASGNRSASATFIQFGTALQVTLTNTSLADVMQPIDVLTAVFFTLAGHPTLTRTSALLAPGSSVLFGVAPDDVVGGEWAYKNGLASAPLGATAGISSVGLGLFGPFDRFPGANLQGPDSPNGLQYGLTSAGDDPATGNAPVTGDKALIRNAVVFTLGLPNDYALTSGNITKVSFQYGTSLSEPNVPGIYTPPPSSQDPVPESSTLVLFGSGLAGLGLWVWKRHGPANSR
jgi:hypothetical protein